MLNKAFDFAAIDIVSYTRDGVTLISNIKAKPAKTVFSADAVYMAPVNLRFSQIDFLIRKADFGDVLPELGDQLIDTDGNKYEVSCPSGEPCWRDHAPEVIRLHCLRMDYMEGNTNA